MNKNYLKYVLIALVALLVVGAARYAMQNSDGDWHEVLTPAPPAIIADRTSGEAPLTVTFTPRFMGLGDFLVKFGDGKEGYSVGCAIAPGPDRDGCGSDDMLPVTHTYSKPGSYLVEYVNRNYEDEVVGKLTITVR